ncbi:MAG: hypothetical protein WKF60_03805 [Ilumatobacter sp.]
MATNRRETRSADVQAPTRSSPRHRPPAGLRWLIGLFGFAAVGFAGALMLSDRAPGFLRTVFGQRARRLWERVDAGGRTDVITTGGRPETDFVVHVAIWVVVTMLVALAMWSWLGLLASAVGVFGSSVLIELAQGRWSSTRHVELRDVAANALGVSAGVVAAAAVYVAWSAVAGTVAALSNR